VKSEIREKENARSLRVTYRAPFSGVGTLAFWADDQRADSAFWEVYYGTTTCD